MSEGGVIRMIGDILCENVSEMCYMKPYKYASSESVYKNIIHILDILGNLTASFKIKKHFLLLLYNCQI
jgi:hypothetical protein